MAATDLIEMPVIATDASRTRQRFRPFDGLLPLWIVAYVATWSVTLGGAMVVALAGEPLKRPVRELLGITLRPEHNPPPDVGHVLALAAHNLPIATWPLLLGVLGAHRNRIARKATDVLLAVWLVLNALPVGLALGAYGPSLLPYLPHLPLEWAGLALGASAWLIQRRETLAIDRSLRLLAWTACVLLCAAVLETFGVPHR